MNDTAQSKPLRVCEVRTDGGLVQIVELSRGRCTVGYLPSDGGAHWRRWGLGEGGYVATCKRFEECPTFNSDAPRGYRHLREGRARP